MLVVNCRLLWRCRGRRSFFSKSIEFISNSATAIQTMVVQEIALETFAIEKKVKGSSESISLQLLSLKV